MDTKDNRDKKQQQQTAENPSGEPLSNPFENKQSIEKDIQEAGDKLQQEQNFKEAQTERD